MSAFESMAAEVDLVAATAGFVVVRLQASPSDRRITAHGFINDELVTSASAADNHLDGVISSAVQSFTMPVPKGARFKVSVAEGSGVEVQWFPA